MASLTTRPYTSSDPDLSAEDIALGYLNLLEAERGFRDLKHTLELRPVFHRLEARIRAHVVLCWLALLLIRVAERQTDTTWRRIASELGRLHLSAHSSTPTTSSSWPRSHGKTRVAPKATRPPSRWTGFNRRALASIQPARHIGGRDDRSYSQTIEEPSTSKGNSRIENKAQDVFRPAILDAMTGIIR